MHLWLRCCQNPVAPGWLMSSEALWWDMGAIQAARAEQAQLQAEVMETRANRGEWAKAGILSKLGRCDPGNPPCVRANERARGVRDSKRLPGSAGARGAAGMGRAGVSIYPSGNRRVRLAVSGPELTDRAGGAGHGWFAGQASCAVLKKAACGGKRMVGFRARWAVNSMGR